MSICWDDHARKWLPAKPVRAQRTILFFSNSCPTNGVHLILLADPRRLMLGNGEDQHSGTIRLITSVAPYLSSQQRHQLEIGILSWSQYDHYPQSDDPKTRLDRSKWDREDRLRLWLAIPRELLTREIRQHVREEERAFPGLKERDCRSSYLRLIGSPMSVEQMAKANDEDVLNLFAELDDVTRRNHPRHWDKGGTIEASRAFEAFAKTNPDRAVSLIRAMQPSKNELTAGHGLVGLAESDYPAQSLFPLLIDLDQRGFSSDDFRHEAVRACEKLVDKQQVLAEEIVGLLETWLSPTEVCEGAEMLDPDEDATNPSHAESVLWSTGGIRTLPHGNFPILATLTKHYLTKQPADAERWLDILEAHMGQKEKMEVWKALAWPYLEPLRLAKKHRAQAFLDHLFGRFPAVRNCREGAFLIAESQRWADGSIVEKWVSDLHNSSWVRAAQASAEITTLHYAWFPSSRWASEWVSQTLDGCWAEPSNLENMRIGVAFTAANLWPIPQYRGLATTVLLQLLRDSSKLVQKAVSDLFRMTKEMPGDEHTRKLLDGLCAYPEVLSRGNANFLVKHLEGLVTSEPQRVYRVCSVILEQIGHKIADVQTSWSLRAGNLVDIALLLQRLGDNNRQNGLALFERLLELDTPNARDILIQLDRRPRHAIP
jgi:hypothetical protein